MSFQFGLGQQGIPQQTLGPQGQVDHQHTVPGVPDAERARIWQQMQNAQNHMQQYRPQGVGDMGGGQGNTSQPFLDLIRTTQNFNRQQQHPMQHAHQQQSFGLGGQMPGVQAGPSMPNPGAHNFQFNQFNKANLNAMQLQQALAVRGGNPNMMQMATHQPDLARQLSLMSYQQPNQPAGASNLAAMRQLQQQQQQQHQQQQQQQQQQLHPNMGAQMTPNMGQNGFFPNATANMTHPDGVSNLLHNNIAAQQPPMQAGTPMSQAQGNQVPMHVVREKLLQVQGQYKDFQAREQFLITNRTGKSDLQLQQELGVVRKGLDERRLQLQRLATMLQHMQGNRQAGPMNNMSMNQAAAGQNGHTPANWLPQNGPSPVNGFVNQQLPNGITASLQQNPPINNTPGGLPLAMHPQGPPRTGPTPLQLANAAQHQSSPNMVPQTPNSQLNGHPQLNGGSPQGMGPSSVQRGTAQNQLPALPAEAFNAAYRQWCQKQNITHDENIMQIDGRKIDLHRLHQEVIATGTYQKIGDNSEAWEIIGGRLEFVQFPGPKDSPPKSGPGVAQQLNHVYKTYLAQFDNTYLRSVLVKRFGNQAAQNGPRPNQPSNAGQPPPSANAGPGIPNLQNNGNANLPQNGMSLQALAALVGTNDHSVLQQVLNLALLSPQDLRQRNLSPQMVQMVEANRPLLQRTAVDQRNRMQQHQQQQQQQHQLLLQQQQQQQQQQHHNNVANSLHPSQQSGVPGMPGPSLHQPMSLANQGQKPTGLAFKQNQQPTAEQIRAASMTMHNIRNQIQMSLPQSPQVVIQESQRVEYARLFEQLFKYINDFESSGKLAVFASIVPTELLRKVLEMSVNTHHQRQLLSSQNPKYILSFDVVRMYLNNLQNLMRNLTQKFTAQPDQQRPPSRLQPPPPPPQAFSPPPGSLMQESAPQPSMHPPQPPVPPQPSGVHTPQLTHPSPRTQSAQVNPSALPKKKPLISETAASSSTPPASASTPANPPTPGRAADSPQTPKSPRATKPVPKPKPKRRPSVKGQPPTPAASTSNAFVTPDHSSPAHPATPESTGTKRKREEEPIVIPQPSSEPSPGKKPRTEWEGTPSEELARKKQEVKAAGETDEDATQFLANTIEMLAMATSEGGQVPSEVTETIDQILRILPATDSSAGLPAFDSLVRDSSPIPAAADIGFPDSEWFDWNSYNDDDHGSKANTPDLVAPPSTNASPGSSGSEVGHGSSHDSACIADPSRGDDDPEARDSLRMGIWNEIGGEAAHYNQDLKWQWEGTMPTLDQPWAIMGSER